MYKTTEKVVEIIVNDEEIKDALDTSLTHREIYRADYPGVRPGEMVDFVSERGKFITVVLIRSNTAMGYGEDIAHLITFEVLR